MKYSWKYFAVYLLPLCFIFLYGKYRCTHKTFKDPLEKEILFGFDGWAGTHVLLFLTIGYLFPKSFIVSMILGISWELFEHLYGKHRPGWLGGYGDCNNLQSDRTEDGNWWYGKWTDIVCNATGFLIGRGLGGSPLI